MNGWSHELVGEHNSDAKVYPEYEEALIGVANRAGGMPPVAAYDYYTCIEILMENGMEYDEAIEYFEFNTLSAWFGDETPLFVITNSED